jgi:hypothetical protein
MWWIAPAVAAATAAFVYRALIVATMTESMRSEPQPARAVLRATSTSFGASEGSSILIPILIPVVLAALPLATRDSQSRRSYGVLSAALLAVFCLISSLTIGALYVPTLLALVAVLALDRWLPVRPPG